MRATHLLLAAAAVAGSGSGVGAPSLAAQTGFNGVITFKHMEEGKPATFVQTTKGRKVRLDGFGSDSGSMIIDGDAKVMMMVQPREKQYMVMTEDDAKQMAAMMEPMAERMKARHTAADSGKFSFTNTGRRETVAGVSCEVWHGSYSGGETDDDAREGDACVARGVGFDLAAITSANPMMRRGGAGWQQMQQYRDLVGADKGILKATRTKDGKTTTELEATQIERKVVSDDAFKAPAGYKEVRVGDMMMKAQNAMKEMQERRKQNQGNGQH
jgi:hypothetical protein